MEHTYQLLQGDCIDLMQDIPDKSIDLILCDHPYGTTKCKWDIIIPFQIFLRISITEMESRLLNGTVISISRSLLPIVGSIWCSIRPEPKDGTA